jgi:uncharacterized membrane protein YphA (DoxX/SURF4 family)
MTFSQYAGVAIVPTISRIILAAAFISAGFNKVFRFPEFTHEQASQLHKLGVSVTLTTPAPTAYRTPLSPTVQLTSTWTSESQTTTLEERSPSASQVQPDSPLPHADAVPGPATSPVVAPTTHPGSVLPPGTYTAQGLHGVTLLLSNSGWRNPVLLANIAAYTELIGGLLVFIGLFSRVWGLGLSVCMATAFYLVSLPFVQTVSPLDWATAANIAAFNTLLAQLGLFALAFGVLLTGPGPLSIDRILFGPSRHEETVVVEPAK